MAGAITAVILGHRAGSGGSGSTRTAAALPQPGPIPEPGGGREQHSRAPAPQAGAPRGAGSIEAGHRRPLNNLHGPGIGLRLGCEPSLGGRILPRAGFFSELSVRLNCLGGAFWGIPSNQGPRLQPGGPDQGRRAVGHQQAQGMASPSV